MNTQATIQREETKRRGEVGLIEEKILIVTQRHWKDAVQTDSLKANVTVIHLMMAVQYLILLFYRAMFCNLSAIF